ncbi:MAG: hypothetical protein AB7F89_10190 [Pirellulaceae bacterium]
MATTHQLPPDDRRAGLPPPRFGLGSLMGVVVLLGVLFAFIHYVGFYGSAIAIFFLLCMGAHVAGNALGMRLRAIGSGPPISDKVPPLFPVSESVPEQRIAHDAGAPSKLRETRSLGWPIVAVTISGAFVGGTTSGYALLGLSDGPPPPAVIVLGMGASAVLGAIWSFAAGSFIQVLVGAWVHASTAPRKARED